MRGDVLWPLLFGSVLTLVTTLVAQWSSLTYQTKRQREARKADFQRTTLLQLREMLGEVDEAFRRAMDARYTLSHEFERENQDPDDWGAALNAFSASHPDMEALRRLTYRLRLLGTAVEHEQLHFAVLQISLGASAVPDLTGEKAQDAQDRLERAQETAVELLGEQLRRLP
jgi:hypothetical protein